MRRSMFTGILWLPVALVFLPIVHTGCKDTGTAVVPSDNVMVIEGSFSQFFLEKGSDADFSYISFRGVHNDGGSFAIEGTSWGVRETGLFLDRRHGPKTATFVFMGECGTVSSRTWEKTTLHYNLARAELDTLWRLEFIAHGDSLSVVKTWILPE